MKSGLLISIVLRNTCKESESIAELDWGDVCQEIKNEVSVGIVEVWIEFWNLGEWF